MPDWRESYRCLAALRPTGWVDPDALACLKSLPADRSVLVACSGGADSVFLTLCVLALFDGDCQRLRIAHFNHGLRGADADADAAFVAEMAAGLGLPCETGRPARPLARDEAGLRAARYAWLDEVYQRVGAGALALGHHADDLVESLLMGLLTGSGPAALASPQPVRRFPGGQVRVRPLMPVARARILATLRALGVPWREDASNRDLDYTRNWLRHEIVPALAARFPQDIHSAAQRTRRLMAECLQALDHDLAGLRIDLSAPDGFDAAALAGAPAALARRALMAWWLRHHPDTVLPAAAADTLVECLCAGTPGPVSIGGGRVLSMAPGSYLSLGRETAAPPPAWPGCAWAWQAGPLLLPDGAKLTGELAGWAAGAPPPYRSADPATTAWLAGVTGPLEVRPWRPGDRYRPLGAPGSRKLQDLFTDAKLDGSHRGALPVVCDGSGAILWVPGFPPADDRRVCADAKSALKLTYIHQLTA